MIEERLFRVKFFFYLLFIIEIIIFINSKGFLIVKVSRLQCNAFLQDWRTIFVMFL